MLHYLISSFGDKCVAHCLDLDIAASAEHEDKAVRRLSVLVKAHLELALQTGNHAMMSNDAPDELWKQFFEIKDCKILGVLKIDVPPEVTAIFPGIVTAERTAA